MIIGRWPLTRADFFVRLAFCIAIAWIDVTSFISVLAARIDRSVIQTILFSMVQCLRVGLTANDCQDQSASDLKMFHDRRTQMILRFAASSLCISSSSSRLLFSPTNIELAVSVAVPNGNNSSSMMSRGLGISLTIEVILTDILSGVTSVIVHGRRLI